MYCEDYPCCGHTPSDPCSRQWYDEPGAFDNPHAFCDHAYGICEVDDDDFGYEDEEFEDEVFEDSLSDAEADAMTLAGAGWGTDEDYGYFGDEY